MGGGVVNAEQVAGLTLAALMLLWLVLDRVAKKRARARAVRFRRHTDAVLAVHAADVRDRNLEANKAARWHG